MKVRHILIAMAAILAVVIIVAFIAPQIDLPYSALRHVQAVRHSPGMIASAATLLLSLLVICRLRESPDSATGPRSCSILDLVCCRLC